MHIITDPYRPKDIGEVMDLLGSMMLGAPTFKDRTGYFANRGIETEFASLNLGLEAIRDKVGRDKYAKLVEISDRMRAHFEAALGGQSDELDKGCKCIWEMEDILRGASRRRQ